MLQANSMMPQIYSQSTASANCNNANLSNFLNLLNQVNNNSINNANAYYNNISCYFPSSEIIASSNNNYNNRQTYNNGYSINTANPQNLNQLFNTCPPQLQQNAQQQLNYQMFPNIFGKRF